MRSSAVESRLIGCVVPNALAGGVVGMTLIVRVAGLAAVDSDRERRAHLAHPGARQGSEALDQERAGDAFDPVEGDHGPALWSGQDGPAGPRPVADAKGGLAAHNRPRSHHLRHVVWSMPVASNTGDCRQALIVGGPRIRYPLTRYASFAGIDSG